MSAAATRAGTSPWLIAMLVALASFMEVLDTTVANVLINYIAGGLGVSEDEASWVVTTYLVANAVALTASSVARPKRWSPAASEIIGSRMHFNPGTVAGIPAR